jgi:hypothetical protein
MQSAPVGLPGMYAGPSSGISSSSERQLSSTERDTKPLTARQLKEQQEYERYKAIALKTDYSSIEPLNIIQQCGKLSIFFVRNTNLPIRFFFFRRSEITTIVL